MGNVHLVTGFAGKAHVTAADHGSLFEATIRSGQFVLDSGAKFAAAIISNNEIRISDGEGVMQGRHFKLDFGSTVSVTIENGTQGQLRNDLIVGRYSKDAESGIEEFNMIALKGAPVETNPADPEYVSGNINAEGALTNDIPLYRVPLNGLTVGELVPLFEVWAPASTPLIISDTQPERKNVIWFDTSRGGSGANDVALLSLDEEESGYAVTASVEGETYGVANASVNAGASANGYDFTVL